MPTLTNYLGTSAPVLLQVKPYQFWIFDRTIDRDLPQQLVNYVCDDEGFSIVCDIDDRIRAIFLESQHLAYAELNLPLQCGRSGVLSALGMPSVSGPPLTHNLLGDYGPWDRYDYEHYSVHIQYMPHTDKVQMVTLMRSDVIP